LIKNEEQKVLIKNKFQLCENYINDLETFFTVGEEPITLDTVNIAKIAMIIGKLSVQLSDLETYLEIYGSIEDLYKEEMNNLLGKNNNA